MGGKYQNDFEHVFHERYGFKILGDPYQYQYVRDIISDDIDIVLSDSDAGTGKTTLAIASAYYLLSIGSIDKIIYVRNTLDVRPMGFLPGTEEEKTSKYFEPAFQALDSIQVGLAERLLENEMLELRTTNLRGINFNIPSVLIIDESQNLSLIELQTVLTRPSDCVKVVVIGSSKQVDDKYISRVGREKLCPFQVFQKHFANNQVGLGVSLITLETNYRGLLSRYADLVNTTVKELEDSNCY